MNNDNFEAIKAEILRRAKEADACTGQYTRAYGSTTLPELCTVIRDNFAWCCKRGVIDESLLMQYREDFAANDIRINENASSGCVLCTGTATVEAWGSATVEARDRATVTAWGCATVIAWDRATVEAWGRATVRAWDSATVEAWGRAYCISSTPIKCELHDNAIYRVESTDTIYYASDDIKFVKQ